MLEFPSNQKPPRNISYVSTASNIYMPLDGTEVIENVYNIMETLQKICSQINSYFGIKVKIEKVLPSLF